MSIAARLAALKARRAERPAAPTPELVSTSEDGHELVESFQPVEDPGDEAGTGEGPVERDASAPATVDGGETSAVALPPVDLRGTKPCRSCGAPVLWVHTPKGKRMPLDPRLIRASRYGTGREVTLVVDGAVRSKLREDHGGDVVGREAHWRTCPDAAQWRKAQASPVDEAAQARGARFRCRRMGLDLHGPAVARALIGGGRDCASVLYRVESGQLTPPEGWPALEARLLECLELHVSRRLAAGERWQDIQVAGWGAADIRDAAATCEAARAL